MSTQPLRIYKDDLEKLKIAAASSGKEEKEILHELLGKAVPEEIQQELVNIAKARSPIKKRTNETVQVQPTTGATQIGERLKTVIADAVETKVYLKTLGISLGDEPKQQYPPYPYAPQYTPFSSQTQQEPRKDIMAIVAEIKALESLGKQNADPQVTEALKEVKDALLKTIQKPQEAKSDIRQRLDELKEYAMTMRIFGTPEESKKAEELFRNELQTIRNALHKAELDAVKSTAQYRQEDLQRQINEIRNAPTELDQIAKISALAGQDEAIRAYMNKKLGIKEKGEPITPKKLKEYIENVQVPVGEILKGLGDLFQKTRGAPAQPPPPPTMQTEAEMIMEREAEIAQKAAPELFHKQPTGPTMSTFAEPEPIEAPPTPPEETSLPPEEEETPSPPKKEPKSKPKKGAKKK